MNYLKQYIKLVRKAQGRVLPEDVYREKHHIFPVSIFGKNKVLVELTYKEHLVAHHLLYKAYFKRYGREDWRTYKAKFAFVCMVNYASRKRLVRQSKIILNLVQILKNKTTPFIEEHHNWFNLKTGKILFDKSGHYMCTRFKKLNKSAVYGVINFKRRKVHNWIIVDDQLKSLYDKKYPNKYKRYNWKNIKTGEILLDTSAEDMYKIYQEIGRGKAMEIARFDKRTSNGWMVVDENLVSLYDQKIPNQQRITGPSDKKFNWKNTHTEEILWGKTRIEMRKKYPELAQSEIASLVNLRRPLAKGWTIVDINGESLYEKHKKISYKEKIYNWFNIETGKILFKKTAAYMLTTYPILSKSGTNMLVYLKLRKLHNWMVVDDQLNSLYDQKYPNKYKRYNWKNIETGEILLDTPTRDAHYIHPEMNPNLTAATIQLKTRTNNGWMIVDENLESIYDKTYPGRHEKYKPDPEKYNWKNINTNEIIWDKTRVEMRKLHGELSNSKITGLVQLKLFSMNGWILIDKNEESLYIQKINNSTPKFIWLNVKTEEILYSKTYLQMAQYIDNIKYMPHFHRIKTNFESGLKNRTFCGWMILHEVTP